MANEDFLEVLALKRLKELVNKEGGREVIAFTEFHDSLSPAMSVEPAEAWAALRSMEENGLIEIDPFDGIRVL